MSRQEAPATVGGTQLILLLASTTIFREMGFLLLRSEPGKGRIETFLSGKNY
jgi:hypothetical protein